MGEAARTIFFGSGTFALPSLERLIAADTVDLAAVITAPPRPAGRKGELRHTPVATAAAAAGIGVSTPSRLRDPDTQAWLAREAPDLVVLADYGRLIPPEVLSLPPRGALNLHPSLLPRHRGASPVPAAILAGDTVTGVTLMQMDAGLDSGPIVAQQEVHLAGTELAADLEQRLAHLGADLLAASLPAWLAGSLSARPQASTGLSLTRPLRRADGALDPAREAIVLERQIRAYQPWPGSFMQLDGERIIVWQAHVEASHAGDVAGTLVAFGDGIALATAAGRLVLDEVQPAGGRRMSAAEWRRGRRAWSDGQWLGSIA